MPQVSVTIAGRVYRMACDEGEEPHLHALAQRLDGKIGELRSQFGEIGDQRITVMAALTMADDLAEAERRIAQLQADLAAAEAQRRAARTEAEAITQSAATAFDGVAVEIDRLAQAFSDRDHSPS